MAEDETPKVSIKKLLSDLEISKLDINDSKKLIIKIENENAALKHEISTTKVYFILFYHRRICLV